MQEIFSFFTGPFSVFIWQGIVLPCVLVTGILFTVQTGGMQIFRFPAIIKEIAASLLVKKKKSKGVTPFRALCTALAGTVGTGSVVGTCQAVAVGGPGALFWLWVAAFFGMIIKYFEVTLSVLYRKKRKDGSFVGGPMYYMTMGISPKARPMALLYALFALASSLGMGCLAQASGVRFGLQSAAKPFFDLSGSVFSVGIGFVTAFLLAAALHRGAGGIGKAAELLIPFMTVLYVGVTAALIFCHRERFSETLSTVLRSAFHPTPFWGAASGIGVKCAVEWGLKRSAFSNEAGLGSAAIAHASAETEDAVKQGFFGILEVFIDTLVICSLTGFSVLTALPKERIAFYTEPDATLITEAVATVFGSSFAQVFLGFSLSLFAFSTLLGWSLYGFRCAYFLFGSRGEKIYGVLFVLLAFFGSFVSTRPIWAISDLFNGLMALPNFIALFLLSKPVIVRTRAYFQKKKTSHKNI